MIILCLTFMGRLTNIISAFDFQELVGGVT